ncbi:TauD/TfdA family dioxygenase [Streptomyces sp. NPDC002078]
MGPEYQCTLDCRETAALHELAGKVAELLPGEPDRAGDALDEVPAALRRTLTALTRPDSTRPYCLVDVAAPEPLSTLPPTPTADRPAPGGHWSAGLLLLVAEILGDLVGYADENDGALIHEVAPEPGMEEYIQNVGSSSLGLHTENVHHPLRPDFVSLLCLRQDHEDVAALRLSSVREAVRHLPPGTLDVLREPLFHSLYPTSFGLDAQGRQPVSAPHAVLAGPRAAPTIRYNTHNTTGATERASDALAALRTALEQVARRIRLRPGQLAVLDNRVVVHGRTAFTPRYDGRDRWLRRCYAVRGLPGGLPALMPRPRVIPALPSLLRSLDAPAAEHGTTRRPRPEGSAR